MEDTRWTSAVGAAALCAVVAMIVAGCGSVSSAPAGAASTGASAAAPPQVRPLGRGSSKPASPRFLVEVNTVCRAVREGAPAALHGPYSPAAVRRHASAAELPTRRTVVSLERLSVTAGGAALQAIASGYTQLQAAYGSAGSLARTTGAARKLGTTIQSREQFVTAAARSAGAPACGVAGL